MTEQQVLAQGRIDELVARAREASEAAYAPYSDFKVGAAVLTSKGEIFTGCNVENASYGLTVCAERVAIWKAVSGGHAEIIALAVFTPTQSITAPCGACRQVAFEFGRDALVVCASNAGREEHSVQQLLPGAFGPQDLGR